MLKLVYSLLLLMVCIIQGCVSDNQPEGPSLKVGDSLPDFSVELNDGSTVSTGLLKGKVPVIVFFNTGCRDCREELPVIQNLWNIYKDSHIVKIVLIAREETEEEISRYWEDNGFTMPFSPQENRDVYSQFAPNVIPRIYIANPDGKIVAAYGDTDMPTLETLISQIEKCRSLRNTSNSTKFLIKCPDLIFQD